MTVVCPVCRDVVHVSCGFILRHGFRYHLKFQICSGSGMPYVVSCDSCSN